VSGVARIVFSLVLFFAAVGICSTRQPSTDAQDTVPAMQLHPTSTRSEVSCFGFDANGDVFFMGTLNGWVYFWTTTNWTPMLTLKPFPPRKVRAGEHQDEFGELTACALSPDGKSFARASGNTVHIYSLPSGDRLKEIQSNADALAYAPNSQRLAVGYGSVVQSWDLHNWGEPQKFALDSGAVSSLAFSPDGRLLAAGTNRATVDLWDTEQSAGARSFRAQDNQRALSNIIAFSPDGRLLASAIWRPRSGEDAVYLWESGSGKQVTKLTKNDGSLRAVAFSPDGTVLAAATSNGVVQFWTVGDWKQRCDFAAGNLSAVTYSQNSKWFATGGGEETVSIWKNPPCP